MVLWVKNRGSNALIMTFKSNSGYTRKICLLHKRYVIVAVANWFETNVATNVRFSHEIFRQIIQMVVSNAFYSRNGRGLHTIIASFAWHFQVTFKQR